MSKKLVKYGNDNALVIDSAILELLEIGEESTLNIRTDGESIIITPDKKVVPENIHETFTHGQARREALIKLMFKRYENIDNAKREALQKKYIDLMERQIDLGSKMTSSSNYLDFSEECKKFVNITNFFSEEYANSYRELINKFFPEISTELIYLEDRIKNFESEHNLERKKSYFVKIYTKLKNRFFPSTATKDNLAKMDTEKQKAVIEDLAASAKKHESIIADFMELQNNTEYQHEAQLLAEKYRDSKNSEDHLLEYNKLIAKYQPDFLKATEEFTTILHKWYKE